MEFDKGSKYQHKENSKMKTKFMWPTINVRIIRKKCNAGIKVELKDNVKIKSEIEHPFLEEIKPQT